MNTLDIYTLKQILLYCPNNITHIGLTCKYQYDFIISDDILRGLYYAPPCRKIKLRLLLEYFNDIDLTHLWREKQRLETNIQKYTLIQSRVHAVVTDNIRYLTFLRDINAFFPEQDTDFNELLIYIVLITNKSHIIKDFFDVSNKSKYKLAEMACISMKHLDSLKYILSLNHTPYVTEHPYYIWNFSKWNDLEDKRCYSEVVINYYDRKQRELDIIKMYVNIITHGNIKCARVIYNLLPKHFITYVLINNDKIDEPQLYENTQHTDELSENLKFVHELGYVFTSEEFDEASKEDNVETLKYLISIDVEFTDSQIKRWLRNPKCRAYLEKND